MVMMSGSMPQWWRADHGAEAAEAGDDLVGDQQDVVLVQHLLDLVPVALPAAA
jgi:hypothetical protein